MIKNEPGCQVTSEMSNICLTKSPGISALVKQELTKQLSSIKREIMSPIPVQDTPRLPEEKEVLKPEPMHATKPNISYESINPDLWVTF